jgi:hypothetical protein
VDNTVSFFHPSESSSRARAPLDARQSTDKVSRDYSHQFVVAGELNSQDIEVPIPRDDLDAATCSDEEALKLIVGSAVMEG